MSIGNELHGTYRGFSPSDESDSGYGEAEVVIDAHKIVLRFATGLGIERTEYLQSQVTELPPSELAKALNGVDPSNLVGFKVDDNIDFLFVSLPGVPGLIVRGMMGDVLGPTALFDPKQITTGLHTRALAEIEESYGTIPRLAKNGLAV